MMKHKFFVGVVCILTLAAVTACGGTSTTGDTVVTAVTTAAPTAAIAPTAPTEGTAATEAAATTEAAAHVHASIGGWELDTKNHWHLCQCGEVFDSAAHTLENAVCTTCGCEIVSYEDGGKQLSAYNEYGDCVFSAFYGPDGSTEYEERNEYTYDASGNILNQKMYTNGNLTCEYQYALNSAGESYLAGDIYYNEDGTRFIDEYDEKMNILRYVSYAADGSEESAYTYEYNDDGSWMCEKTFLGGRLAAECAYMIDADGLQQILTEVTYNDDGSWVGAEYDLYGNMVIEIHNDAQGNVVLDRRCEHTYDADGNKLLTKTYDNGVLVEEVEYRVGSDGEGTWSIAGKTTIYHEDGTKTVTDSDEGISWSTEITYDANGNVIEELRYEYERDDSGESVGSKTYRNGVLIQEMHNVTDANGQVTGLVITDYEEDGGKTVSAYDTNLDLTKKTIYDAAGNIISGPPQ